ncbi:alpha,alpha-phosphotrehalase [Jeotgalibacillus salarius]|uniref:Alpha,alpha-phosphotrehalase n=1 Tax=Jeotgalibacillus salarius TaxID=546023 RepID=A0A4Y8LLZ0_9BACL|nr:alpha,alpha-phosphotrehalase [Jeotgalibacillus salarius]TFE03966.1 alpha,alpha-phosphotrehalase [Jeotgalibacillus salarius]
MAQPWWKKAVVYQIYPKSFNDTTGNGVGDLNGITKKLDYLNELGVDVLWLTPPYKSPQRDNGYDISDYFSIHSEYGSMEDFDRMLEEAHKRDIRIIMDIVVNHTSTEHEWFIESRKSKDSEYRDFYIWKDGKDDGSEPTNWVSKFGGNAWQYDEATGQYYLHLFDVTQADLNWENEKVRREIYDMMNYWAEKGVDGFRLDVINLVSKNQDFPDETGDGDGRRFYTDGPRVHEYMYEMNQEVFSKHDLLTVGEMSSTTIDHCVKYSNPAREELSMTFNFHHLKVDYPNGEKWTVADFDFLQLKDILSTWQVGMNEGGGWNALFWCNHDQPRVVSRYGNDGEYHNESAKMLATSAHMMQGTPYIFQGEEFGMTNPKFTSIDEYRDVESLNIYNILLEKGKSEEEILKILRQKSRDNSRTPVQWDDSENAGFTSGTPWIPVAKNYSEHNAAAALEDRNSVFYYYQKLIQLRKDVDVITNGNYEMLLADHPSIFAYTRNNENETLLVLNNYYAEKSTFSMPAELVEKLDGFTRPDVLIQNYKDVNGEASQYTLRPYESIVFHYKK